MKLNIELDEADPTQVANGLVQVLTAAAKTGVSVEVNDGAYTVSSHGEGDECVRHWVGSGGEYRRDVMERRWVIKESTDASGRKVPAPSV
jgi:hypothetical protein